jgi:BNR repeat-like domain
MTIVAAALAAVVAIAVPAVAAAAARQPAPTDHRSRVGPIAEISRGCPGQNAEAEQAVDGRYVYVAWIGCNGIGFARSANGGRSFDTPVAVPGSEGHGFHKSGIGSGLPKYGWDPSVAVAPDHRIYVAYMLYRHSQVHPMVAVSDDHGATFARVSGPQSPVMNNWGDRDFITVSPAGTLYLTWDFGRSLKNRHANIVIQRSRDGGRTWSPLTVVSPGFPDHGGGVAAPLLAEPGGRLDVALWVWSGGARAPYALPPNHIYFTSSADGGRIWSKPVAVRPGAGRIGFFVTWIDVALSSDAAGNLYATWDTQSPGGDIGWLAFSTDHGRTWSSARRVTPDHDKAEHIMAVTSGSPGIAYVGWLSDNSSRGFAQYLRPFSIRTGWLARPIQVSRQFGNRNIWPGDTIGISLLPASGHAPRKIQLSWGSAVSGPRSQIFTATVTP